MLILVCGVMLLSCLWQLLNQNNANNKSAKQRSKTGGPGSGVEVWEREENAQETAPVGLQEGAGGLSFTVVCIPKGMHSCPRVRDNYTAARLYEKMICRDENLILWVLNNSN